MPSSRLRFSLLKYKMYELSQTLYPPDLVPGSEELAGAVLQAQVLVVDKMYDMSPALYPPAHLVPGSKELAGAVLKAQVLAVHHPQGLDARQHQVLRHLKNIHKKYQSRSWLLNN